jgi:hypothetical protein
MHHPPVCPICRRDVRPHESVFFQADGAAVHLACMALGTPSVEHEFVDFLRSRAGRPYCSPCIADVLSVPHRDAAPITSRLQHVVGFRVGFDRCSLCQQQRVTIAAVDPGTGSPPPPPATS